MVPFMVPAILLLTIRSFTILCSRSIPRALTAQLWQVRTIENHPTSDEKQNYYI